MLPFSLIYSMSRLEARQAAVLRKFKQWQWVETLVVGAGRSTFYYMGYNFVLIKKLDLHSYFVAALNFSFSSPAQQPSIYGLHHQLILVVGLKSMDHSWSQLCDWCDEKTLRLRTTNSVGQYQGVLLWCQVLKCRYFIFTSGCQIDFVLFCHLIRGWINRW